MFGTGSPRSGACERLLVPGHDDAELGSHDFADRVNSATDSPGRGSRLAPVPALLGRLEKSQ